MGGLVCAVHRNAVLKFQTVPTSPSDAAAFDDQIRQLYNAPTIAESIVSDTTDGMTACQILAKNTFTMQDRQKLLDIVESLYKDYG